MNISLDRRIDRRDFLIGTGAVLGSLWLPRATRAEHHEVASQAQATAAALEKSPLVYISPLQKDGSESRCHGEVWYFVDGGDVVIATASDGWKSRAVKKGRDRARIWVGDFGRARSADGPFRKGPTFLARAEFDSDRAAFDRLLAAFAKKYPDEWDKWEPRFRKGYDDGSRVVIRYAAAEE